MIKQMEISLPPFSRGVHLITGLLEKKLGDLPEKGIVNILLLHTSAAVCINENADPSVRYDFKSFLDKLIPENDPVYTHLLEGDDDMPAHLKSSILGQSLTIPISKARLKLGTWQGIYLCEFRNSGGSRNLFITVLSD